MSSQVRYTEEADIARSETKLRAYKIWSQMAERPDFNTFFENVLVHSIARELENRSYHDASRYGDLLGQLSSALREAATPF